MLEQSQLISLADGTTKSVPVTQSVIDLHFHIERHSVEHCTCSNCHPEKWGLGRDVPPLGRFSIEVPPKDNKWRWTAFTLRIGGWRYHTKLPWKLFPSVKPFFVPEKWEDMYKAEEPGVGQNACCCAQEPVTEPSNPKDDPLAHLLLVIHYMQQEAPFVGRKITFSDAVKELSEKYMDELTEEEIQTLIQDGYQQLRVAQAEEEAKIK